MGLLHSDNDTTDDLAVTTILEGVCQYWDKYLGAETGCVPEFSSKGVNRICRFASKHIFTSEFFPFHPGPFKRAAALTVLVRHLECVKFADKDTEVHITDEEKIADYKAKFAFFCISPTLQNLELDKTAAKLEKRWAPATNHLRAELIAWLKWLEAPIQWPEGPNAKGLFDVPRVCRAIMALSMIIEQSYYIAKNKITCDVMEKPCPLKGEDNAVIDNLLADLSLTDLMNMNDSR